MVDDRPFPPPATPAAPTTPERLAAFADRLAAARAAYALPPQLRARTESLTRRLLALLFPPLASEGPACDAPDVAAELAAARDALAALLAPVLDAGDAASPASLADHVLAALPDLHAMLMADAESTFAGDPAATSVDEVVAAYPGFYATACYRLAHLLHRADVPVVPRLITEFAHRETGIDIHPGATIGRAFAIDHGTGVVIGETATLGDRVRLYQGVTLGAAAVAKALARVRRHPTLEDDVIVYANATILGGDTIVGAGSVIGGNVWLTRSVPPGSVVSHTSQVARRPATWDGVEDFSI